MSRDRIDELLRSDQAVRNTAPRSAAHAGAAIPSSKDGCCGSCGRPDLVTNIAYSTATLDVSCTLGDVHARKLELLPTGTRNIMFNSMRRNIFRLMAASIDKVFAAYENMKR